MCVCVCMRATASVCMNVHEPGIVYKTTTSTTHRDWERKSNQKIKSNKNRRKIPKTDGKNIKSMWEIEIRSFKLPSRFIWAMIYSYLIYLACIAQFINQVTWTEEQQSRHTYWRTMGWGWMLECKEREWYVDGAGEDGLVWERVQRMEKETE